MKTLGILGGMTPHSTIIYYRSLNEHIQRALGGNNSASLILNSFNFAEMSALFAANRWDTAAAKFIDAAKHMKAGGAQGIAIGCNIGHKVAREVEAGAQLPVLHIAEYTARAVREKGLSKVALLATRAATEGDFIKAPLGELAGVEVLIPDKADVDAIDAVIFGELGSGVVTKEITTMMQRVVNELVEKGAQGVVLACTDLQFVLTPENVSVPVFDTLELHVKGLAEWMLEDSG